MPLFKSYDTPVAQALETALDPTDPADCATIKIETDGLSFTIEYLYTREGACFNITGFADDYRPVLRGGAIEAGCRIADQGPAWVVAETDATTPATIRGQIEAIVAALGVDHYDAGARTKHTWNGWEDALAHLLPFGERWFEPAHEQS